MPEVNRFGPGLEPERREAALNLKLSFCLPDNPGFVGMKLNQAGIVGGGCAGSVHEIVILVRPSLGEHEVSSSAKLNQACVGHQRYQVAGAPFTPGIVRSHDELTIRQGLFPATGFHGPKYKLGNRRAAMGCLPPCALFVDSTLGSERPTTRANPVDRFGSQPYTTLDWKWLSMMPASMA